MISHIKGKVIHKDNSFSIIDVNGIGYKVFSTGNTLENIETDTEVSLWTHLAVRENSHDLYGFLNREELEFFELLITVSGIGPKTALNILNIVSADTLRHAVFSENTVELVKISGIGRKTAEKIVLELKGKFSLPEDKKGSFLKSEGDAIEALTSLGYKEREARDALKNISKEIVGTSERVREALKVLGSKF